MTHLGNQIITLNLVIKLPHNFKSIQIYLKIMTNKYFEAGSTNYRQHVYVSYFYNKMRLESTLAEPGSQIL